MMTRDDSLYINEESIDQERIVNDDCCQLKDFLCPICCCLSTKPRSCKICQNLFCNKCIQTWLKKNSHTCPLCRSIYEEKPVSTSIQTILSKCLIHCRNNLFGCQEILPYDLLEQHETIECEYLSKKCLKCDEDVLLTNLSEHKTICRPLVIQCPLCQYSIKSELFEKHQDECIQRCSNLYEDSNDDLLYLSNFPHDTILQPRSMGDLVGIESYNQSRDKNIFVRFSAMIRLMLTNFPVMHLILFNLFGWACGNFIRILTIYFLSSICSSIYQSIIFSILFNYSLYFILESINDVCLLSLISFALIISSLINPKIQIDEFQMNFNLKELLLFIILIFFFLEIPILLIRLYFYYIPIHIGTICLALIIYSLSKYFHVSTIFCI